MTESTKQATPTSHGYQATKTWKEMKRQTRQPKQPHSPPYHQDEVGPKQVNPIHDKHQMGNRVGKWQRKCKTPSKHESISWHETQTVRSPATTKSCSIDHTTTRRPLPPKWVPAPLQYHRDPRMRMWRRKGNSSRSISTKL